MIEIVFGSRKTTPCPFCGRNKVFCTIEIEKGITFSVKGESKSSYKSEVICHYCGTTVYSRAPDREDAINMAIKKWESRV